MNYRKITEKVANNLTLSQIYGFYVLAMKSDYNTLVSYINQDTLASLVDVSESTIKRWIKAYEESGLLSKQTDNIKKSDGKWIKKNTYQLNDENYKLISDGLLSLDCSTEMKGFLILLKCRCYNCSNNCKYTIQELADTTAISKSTVGRYLKQAEELGYIKRDKNGITLLDAETFIPHTESEYYAALKTYPEILTDEDIAEHKIH